MRIVFNTDSPSAASSAFYIEGLRQCSKIVFEDRDYRQFDIALIMTYEAQWVSHIKAQNPSIKVGILDPRGESIRAHVDKADFLVCDSLEMEDFWLSSGKPIFRYAEYPNISPLSPNHQDKEKIVIGYHGNLLHLNHSKSTALAALEALGPKYDIELHVMYNVSTLGEWSEGRPENLPVRVIDWSMDNYHKFLALSDIGIVPNNLPPPSHDGLEEEFVTRFKMPSNPGRIIVFGLLGIPVVADFYPSAFDCIKHGYSGFLAHNAGGWEFALERLILDPSLRQKCALHLQDTVKSRYNFKTQNLNLLQSLHTVFSS